jgi:predicted SAM-dependent methyltransferase
MYAELPEEWRKWPALRDPIEPDDPSEAVRSSAILPAVRRLFHVLVERPYGGHIVSILLWQMNLPAVPERELNRVVARWLAMEEDDLATKPEASYHTAVVARPRIGLDGIASRASVFLSPVSGASDGAAANARVTASTRDAGAGICDTHHSETMGLFRRGQSEKDAPRRLHIGCGQQAIPGWINIDNQALPGVDRVLDIRRGLPYNGVSAIYAEHFLEHLGFEEGLGFLRDCRRALADFGVLRVSTPNLDWVYTTHYPSWPSGSGEKRLRDCFNLNQAFHGWGHQFLYNRPTLEAALKAAGFADVVFQRYGESNIPDLNALERHETYLDTPELPHVLIAEASGEAREVPLPEEVLRTFRVVINAR